MATNPVTRKPARDAARTAPTEASARASVASAADRDPTRGQPRAGSRRQPRDQRELDEHRRALANLILGVFDQPAQQQGADQGTRAPGPADSEQRDAASSAQRNARLEVAVVEFMYALFDALDEIDDSEPTLCVDPPAPVAVAAAQRRSAFGERVDLLARRVESVAEGPMEPSTATARLARSHAAVLQAIHTDSSKPHASADQRAAIGALLRRLANALQVAPTLGVAAPSTAGALLRVRA